MGFGGGRTRRTTEGGGPEPQRKYPPTPAATMRTPSAMMRAGLRLTMHLPPLDDKRGNQRKREVDEAKDPETAPIARQLPHARPQQVEPDRAVSGSIHSHSVTRPSAHPRCCVPIAVK